MRGTGAVTPLAKLAPKISSVTISEKTSRADDPQESEGKVLAVRDATVVRERLKTTTCRWCGELITYAGVGRPPRYCRDSHRKRASELRTAQRRSGRPVDEGGRTSEPVREVVERVETRTRTTVRRGWPEIRLPQDIYGWMRALRQLQNEVRDGQHVGFHDVLVRDLEGTVRAIQERQQPRTRQEGDATVPPPRARPQGSKKKRRKRR